MKKEIIAHNFIIALLILLIGSEAASAQAEPSTDDEAVAKTPIELNEKEPPATAGAESEVVAEPLVERATSKQASADTTPAKEPSKKGASFGVEDAQPEKDDAGSEERAQDENQYLGALKQEPGLNIGARLYTQWMLRDEPDQPSNEFRINIARFQLTWTQWKLVKAQIELDADQLVEDAGDTALLRDFYVRVQPRYWIGARIGQFKRPFSRVELTSRQTLPFINRGIGNDYITEHLLYGDRDIGLMLEGRLLKQIELDYAIGVFNGMGKNAQEIAPGGSKDIAARLETRPVKWISLGANASFKYLDREDLLGLIDRDNFASVDPREYPNGYSEYDFMAEHEWMAGFAWMTGIDAALRVEKLRIVLEGMLGENWWFERYPKIWSALLTLSYKYKLIKGWPLWVEPVFRAEVLTVLRSMDDWRVRMWQLVPGVNLHLGKHVRLMIEGEFVLTQGNEAMIDGSRKDGLWPNEWPGLFADFNRLIVQLAFSM
ncbi:MAG: hypothetical protein JXA30_12245 [Deltaproteobacteria bacterium]|nr:hypothetical protein [Deltaproteobacteria bacterium]